MIIFKPHEALKYIKRYLPENPVIVEAGAFDGADTVTMAQLWPTGTIHAFEPVPELFEKLKKNTAHLTNVHCYQRALSNQDGTAQFYVSEKPTKPGVPSQAGSLLKPKERLDWSPLQFPYTIQVQTITLPTWTQQNNSTKIDLLWLDIQGNELTVLKAAAPLLQSVQAMYTEVAFIEAYENQPTYEEVKSWLEAHNFKEIGRTFENQTDWFFGNVLFVKQ